ncbi:penicillin-binding protein [bacterium]|nr:penicillin-binding protein [bacterium]
MKKIKKIKRWATHHTKELVFDLIILIIVVGLFAFGALFIWIATLDIPDLSSFDDRRVLQSTKIYDRTGEILLYDLHQDVKRTVVPFEEISFHIKNATVAIEDDEFYNHSGVDLRAILRAVLSNLATGDLLGGQGGSTITQQVVKNSILEQDKKLTRKIKEAILAIRLEQVLTKEEILNHYLNESPYGGTIYGIEEASQAFFGKGSNEVSLAEAAYLAALPQAPTYLSPYGNHIDALEQRKNLVLKRMQLNDFITQEEYDEAKDEIVEFEPQAVTGIRAPHFVMYVKEKLVEKYGEEALLQKGFRVITSLNWDMQKEAEAIVVEKAAYNTENFDAENAGLIALDPQTGDVLAMVGSRDYFDEEIDGNFNVTLAPRQPGSSIKPIVYSSALSEGYTADTVVYDVKTQFSTECEPYDTSSEMPCYAPNNYNGKFLGPVTFRNALAQSLNIPAVKALYLTGLKDAIKLASDMGITTLNDPDKLGLTLVLGGGEVKLLEHTNAYSTLANEGVHAEIRPILRVEDVQRKTIEEFEVEDERVLDRDVALTISDILSDNEARTPLWGANSLVHFSDRDVAVKSGSTNNLRDAWIMGYTPNLAVGTWVGNNDNRPMGGRLSGLITAPMWRAFMDKVLPMIENEEFPQAPETPSDIKPILRGEFFDTAFFVSQLLDNPGETQLDLELMADSIHSILHYVIKDDPRGEYPSSPSDDGQYKSWEYGVQQWKKTQYGGLVN